MKLLIPLIVCVWMVSVRPAQALSTVPLQVRTVVLEGETAPGFDNGAQFHLFNAPLIDSFGRTIVHGYAQTSGTSVDTYAGIWMERQNSGGLGAVVVEGQPLLGELDYRSSDPDTPLISSNGTMNYRNGLYNAGGVPLGLGTWVQQPGKEPLLLTTSMQIAGITVPVLSSFVHGASDLGETVLSINTGGDKIYKSDPAGNLRLIAEAGRPVPGAPGLNYSGVDSPGISDTGHVSWAGRIAGAGNLFGLWKEVSGEKSLVARQGGGAPGTDGATFHRFLSSSIDSYGQVSFSSWVVPGTDNLDVGVWREREGFGIEPVLVEGAQAPGVENGVRFGNMTRNIPAPAYSDSGHIAMGASLIGPELDATNDSGIWLAKKNEPLQLVVREGMHAPGTEPDTVFGHFSGAPTLAVNDRGMVAFLGFLQGPSINTSNERGIWATSADGQLHLIAREGDLHSDQEGNAFKLEGLMFVGDGFNRNGHLAFWGQVESPYRDGIFVSTLVAVPEPRAIVLLVGLLAIVIFRQRYVFG